jgi:acyl-coenzyme A thioesterase PaaI-like protein
LAAHGKLINTTRRTAYVEGHVEDEQGQLIAKASATLMLMEHK